jgi:spore cortex formation protein SpoVR/YcgB (stage V sporulation)
MTQGVFRYRRPAKLKMGQYEQRRRERLEHEEKNYRDLWRTVPLALQAAEPPLSEQEARARKQKLKLPEENLLYFLEKNSPILQDWQRELLRIIRNIAQYFYPQRQTKLMNEGCATFVHYYIVNRLYDKGLISEGALLEILHSHSNVVFQPAYDDPGFGGMNPYALGFAMMQDIERMCVAPTAEDREWFPDFAGNNDWRATLKDVWANYRDESFVRQFLSPHLIRKLKLFVVTDKEADPRYRVDAIHDADGYRRVRSALADSYDVTAGQPDIQVADVDLLGNRELVMRHEARNGIGLSKSGLEPMMRHIRNLWGYDVRFESGPETD